MEFKQLQSFVAVVDYGSFTKASEKLFISQPTISTHIRMLEDEFQSCLLVRTTKSIELTPRGQEFYECAVSILSLKNHLIESWINESRNVIHMGASTIPSTYLLPELLPGLQLLPEPLLSELLFLPLHSLPVQESLLFLCKVHRLQQKEVSYLLHPLRAVQILR